MNELAEKYFEFKNDHSLSKTERNKRAQQLRNLKKPFYEPPRDGDYTVYGASKTIRTTFVGRYPTIKLHRNERPMGDPNVFAKALVNPYTVVVSDLNIDNFNIKTHAAAYAINVAAKMGGDLLVVGNVLAEKYQNNWDLIIEFMSKLKVHKAFLILGPYDILSVQDYIDLGFNYVTDRAEKTFNRTKIIYSYFPLPVMPYQLNIHGHPSDFMYSQMGIKGHWDAQPLHGIQSIAVNTLGSIIAEVNKRDGTDI